MVCPRGKAPGCAIAQTRISLATLNQQEDEIRHRLLFRPAFGGPVEFEFGDRPAVIGRNPAATMAEHARAAVARTEFLAAALDDELSPRDRSSCNQACAMARGKRCVAGAMIAGRLQTYPDLPPATLSNHGSSAGVALGSDARQQEQTMTTGIPPLPSPSRPGCRCGPDRSRFAGTPLPQGPQAVRQAGRRAGQ